MPTWKKLLVSGSTISQLDNDAGYLASAGEGIVSSSIQIDHDQTTNYSADEHFTQANITTVGTVTAGSVTAILPAGTVSGSIQVDYLGLSNISSGIISASAEGDAQGQIKLNGVNVDTNNLGSGDSPQFTNLTLTGNLVVQGDTINANVTNLDIEDRYILLNSGSSTIGDSGIVFGGANGVAQSGVGLVWDASYNSNDGRLAIVNTIASDATGDTTPNYTIAGVFEGTEASASIAQADHPGNIRIESEDIFIYV